jgi:hypothetical protein
MAAARCSISAVTGENTELIAAAVVERRDLAPIEFVAAAQHVAMAADGGRQIVRPIGQRRQGPSRRKTEADRRHRNQTPPLDDGVGEVRGADHHRPDVGSGNFGFAQQIAQHADDAGTDVRRCRRLAPSEHVEPVHQNGVGIGASDIDADAHCHKAPAFVRPSDPASREAPQNSLPLLSIRSPGGLASRANGASHGGLPHF